MTSKDKWALLLACLLVLGIGSPAQGGPIALETFYEFSFQGVGPAAGCAPADPGGGFCIPSSGTPTSFVNAPPWTFTAPAVGAILTVTDAFEAGDRFQVFDFGASLGLTSAPIGSADCGDDPVPCLADPRVSKAILTLAAGNHSITINATQTPAGGGVGYLRVEEIPEPATLFLLSAGLAALYVRGRSKSRNT